MILPVLAYGNPVLKKRCRDISKEFENLLVLVEDMFETMYAARGVGLAAPQIGKDIRLFIIDTTPFQDDDTEIDPIKRVFVNAVMEEEGDEWLFNEGCLSIPDIREDISRKSNITISYMDQYFNEYKESFSGITARVIQHEYDHIEGKLFTDKLSPLRKRMLKRKLLNISKGNIEVDYRMKFYVK